MAASSDLSSFHRDCCEATSAATRSLIRSSCSAGVRPSSEISATPESTWPTRPATRTMKNSSRLLAEIDRNRSRSSSGWLGLAASSKTRRLNSSHDNSRLMNRSGDDSNGGGSSFVAIGVGAKLFSLVAAARAKLNSLSLAAILIQLPGPAKRGKRVCFTNDAETARVARAGDPLGARPILDRLIAENQKM